MRKFGFLVLCSILGAGWYMSRQPNDLHIDPKLEPYVQEWIADCEQRNVMYHSAFKTIAHIKLVPYDGDPHVGSSSWWNQTITIEDLGDEALLRTAVYHELGHYVFNKSHRDSGQIMSSHIDLSNSSYYSDNWASLRASYFKYN